MFKQVFIIQCISTGKFLTHQLNHTYNMNRAGYLLDRQSAIDTGFNELENDFVIYDFYKPVSMLPAYCGGASGEARTPQ